MSLTVSGTNPIVVTGDTDESAPIKNAGTIEIAKIYWLRPTTEGHKLALQDGKSNELHEFYCKDADVSLQISFEKGELTAYDGIYCDDMDSGELRIHLY